jgi:nucleoside 2-deoxyribosyltransferase
MAYGSLEVFLSHASTDREHVEVVRRQIEAHGIHVYLAELDPKPGTQLAEKVKEAIERADAVVVLVTTASMNSAYVQQEIGVSLACGRPIIPIVDIAVAKVDLAMLTGVEYLELDMTQPAEAMAKVTASLQPLVMAQAERAQVPAPVPSISSSLIDPAAALLIGALLLLVAALLLAEGGS